jgi:hypothetical protein
MLVAATGHLRRFATLFAIVAVSASVAAGCGGGGSETVKTPTQSGGPPSQPGGPETSAPAFVGKIEKTAPEQIAHVCLLAKAKGNDAAFADFKKGYALAFPDETLSPKKVFDEILKHCD